MIMWLYCSLFCWLWYIKRELLCSLYFGCLSIACYLCFVVVDGGTYIFILLINFVVALLLEYVL